MPKRLSTFGAGEVTKTVSLSGRELLALFLVRGDANCIAQITRHVIPYSGRNKVDMYGGVNSRLSSNVVLTTEVYRLSD
jgi:hypothetical protein